ncbi:MAG: hypothetical protein HUU35_09170 [Armatimonadetes bacterium]|nr:hypothetical protein [Armatimonadota bacterium]
MIEDYTFDEDYPSLREAEADLRLLLPDLAEVEGAFWEEEFCLFAGSPDWAEVSEGLDLEEAIAVLRTWYDHDRDRIAFEQRRKLLFGEYTIAFLRGYPDHVAVLLQHFFNHPELGPNCNVSLSAVVARRSADRWAVACPDERAWLHVRALYGDPEIVGELIVAGDTALAAEVERIRLRLEEPDDPVLKRPPRRAGRPRRPKAARG